jgi:hypothetical protein
MCSELDMCAGKLLLGLTNVVVVDMRAEGEAVRVTARSDAGEAE